jgi:hypothetical protein
MLDRITELRAQYRNKLLKKYDIGGTTPPWQNSSMKKVVNNFLTEEERAAKEKAGLPQDSTLIGGTQTETVGPGDGSGDVSFWTNLTNPQGWRNPFARVDTGEDKTNTNPTQEVTSDNNFAADRLAMIKKRMAPQTEKTAAELAQEVEGKGDSVLANSAEAPGIKRVTLDPKDKKQTEQDRLLQLQMVLGAPAGDISTNLYNFGRAMGMKSGTKGKSLMAVGFGGAGLLGAARQTMSGIGYSKAQQYTDKYTQDQLLRNQNQYTAAAQTENTNNVGGQSFRQGGFFRYEDGGENEEELMQMADNGNPGEMQQQQEGNPQQEEKIIQIAQELVNGLGSLEAIDAYLREQEVDEQMYGMIMHVAEQILGESEQEQDQGEEIPEEGQEQPEMNEGGEFNKNVGDFIEFEYEGKKYSGKISKIENGQIYL